MIRNRSRLHRKIARSNVEANGVTRGHTHTRTHGHQKEEKKGRGDDETESKL